MPLLFLDPGQEAYVGIRRHLGQVWNLEPGEVSLFLRQLRFEEVQHVQVRRNRSGSRSGVDTQPSARREKR